MAVNPKWQKIQRACEWPIAVVAFGSAVVVLAHRLGALPAFEPLAIWAAAIAGIMAGVGTFVFVAGGAVALWAAHSSRADAGQRTISVLSAGLKFTAEHCVCRACVGRGFTWTLVPAEARASSGGHVMLAREDIPRRLKVECPSCGGSGFIDL